MLVAGAWLQMGHISAVQGETLLPHPVTSWHRPPCLQAAAVEDATGGKFIAVPLAAQVTLLRVSNG